VVVNVLILVRWLHRLPISPTTLVALHTRHNSSLRILRLYSVGIDKFVFGGSGRLKIGFEALETFECRTMGFQTTFVGTTIAKSSRSLRKLRFGQQARIVAAYAMDSEHDGLYGTEDDIVEFYTAGESCMGGTLPSDSTPGHSLDLNLDTLEIVAEQSAQKAGSICGAR
jgi:hypothetical protein